MSADLLAAAEKDNNLDAMCRITTECQFSFDTVFAFLNDYRMGQADITPVLKKFLLWALDRIQEDPTRDVGDYVLQTIDIAVNHNDVAFFTTIVTHHAVAQSAWPMMGACSGQKYDLIDVLFKVYEPDAVEQLAQWMLKSNLRDGVREHLEQCLFIQQSTQQSERISQHLEHHMSKSTVVRKI